MSLQEIETTAKRRARRGHRRSGGGAVLAVAIAVLAIVWVVSATTKTNVIVGPSPAGSVPLSPVTAPVSASLELPGTSVQAGGSLSGQVVIDNNTRSPLHVDRCGAIFQVLLVNATYHPQVVWPLCLAIYTVPVGESKYPVEIVAKFDRCDPSCIPSLPLAPGHYEATTFEDRRAALGRSLPLPGPVAFTVTAAGS